MTSKLIAAIMIFLSLILISANARESARFGQWAFSFETGFTIPTERFDEIIDGNYSMGLNLEYMSYPFLGGRISYNYQKFDYLTETQVKNNLEFNSLAVSAVVAYPLPEHFRVFAVAGPCYFSAEGQELVGLGEDGKDIGWNAGAGFEFYPVLNWGIRFESIYYSAEIGSETFRSSWVDSVLGLTFRF